jgi:hypothetical protein
MGKKLKISRSPLLLSFFIFIILGRLVDNNAIALNAPDSLQKLERQAVTSMQEFVGKIKYNPSYGFESKFDFGQDIFSRIINCAKKDSAFITRGGVFEYYLNLIQSSTNTGMLKRILREITEIGKIYCKKKESIVLLKKVLHHRFIEVRLYAANQLFDEGCKEDAYTVYADLLKRQNLREWLDSEYTLQFAQELNAAEKMTDSLKKSYRATAKTHFNDSLDIVRQEKKLKRIQNKLEHKEFDKIKIVVNVLHKLTEYDDPETRSLVKNAVTQNPYVSAALYRPLSLFDTTKIKVQKGSSDSRSNSSITDIELFIKETK